MPRARSGVPTGHPRLGVCGLQLRWVLQPARLCKRRNLCFFPSVNLTGRRAPLWIDARLLGLLVQIFLQNMAYGLWTTDHRIQTGYHRV